MSWDITQKVVKALKEAGADIEREGITFDYDDLEYRGPDGEVVPMTQIAARRRELAQQKLGDDVKLSDYY